MTARQRYRRRPDQPVVAIRLTLDTPGFTYTKWGGQQHCKQGDWLVDNQGEVYTVDAASFAETYSPVGSGRYAKTGKVWAERATQDGSIRTKEGATAYAAGDMLVYNDEAGADGYAMSAQKFDALYEPDVAAGDAASSG